MKLLQMGLLATLLSSSVAHALDPIPGWYAGFLLSGSKAPDIDFNVVNPVNGHSGNGVLSYSLLGGLGLQAGYRMKHLRFEGEFFYNNNPYSHLKIGRFNVPNANSTATTIQQLSTQLKSVPNPFTFQGYTNTYAMMFNGFYDLYIPDYTDNFVPYLGAGVGYAQVQNNILFKLNGTSIGESDQHTNNLAGQVIVGLSYFLTDYTAFSFDARYFSATKANTTDARFNSFQSRPKLYSLNLVFNAAFNLA